MATSKESSSASWRLPLLLCVSILDLAWGHLKYSVLEELAPGTAVGNIAKDLGLDLVRLNSRGLKITDGDRKQLFQVNMSSGALIITDRIDREELCGQSSACRVHSELVIDDPLEMHRLEVEVIDVNDNAPEFLEKEDILHISEFAATGTRFPIPKALDLDIGKNTIQGYALSPNSHFELKTATRSDGRKSEELILTKMLDREVQPVHKLILQAFDGGDPKRSGSTLIFIKVTDVNDNVPTFNESVYRVTLPENVPIGTTVTRLNATDLDEGQNGEVRYYFNKRVATKIKTMFHLDETTGVITLTAGVDFEETRVYELSVEAKDKGHAPVAGLCDVVIEIMDANDNPPVITVSSLSAYVPEDAKPGTVIALLTVLDRDSGANGEVLCSVPTTLPFQLQNPFNNHYSLILKDSLDREATEEYSITITATDRGSPPLSASTTLEVRVSDVNDNTPVFAQPSYSMFVNENNVPGTHVFTVSAFDSDLKENGYLTYSLLANASIDSFVSINSENGKVHALKSFDYEETQRFHFQVLAKDAGVPSLSSTVSVEVFILDQNDNAPSILSPNPQKEYAHPEPIPASVDSGYLVSKIRAMDADSGYNAWLSYQMVQNKGTPLFKVGLYSGEVRTSRAVREQDRRAHSLVVLVKDHGDPALTSTVTLSIALADNSNDKHNQFIKTPESEHSISEVNLYLVISIAFISFVFLVTIIIFTALRIYKAKAALSTYCQTACANQSWYYNQSNSYRVCLGNGRNSILIFNNACPEQPEGNGRSTLTLDKKTRQSIDDLLMLEDNQVRCVFGHGIVWGSVLLNATGRVVKCKN